MSQQIVLIASIPLNRGPRNKSARITSCGMAGKFDALAQTGAAKFPSAQRIRSTSASIPKGRGRGK